MIAVPLEVSLRTLAPNRLVWIQRGGLVYPYPARIVRDIANDLYVTYDEFNPSITECDAGSLLADHYGRGTNRASLQALSHAAWSYAGNCDVTGFEVWWDSVDQSAPPIVIGTAASFAARNVLTWSLFKHRHLVDTPRASL